MLRFFSPVSKVQKDRQIMRSTDERMAKYSRRGLITNFLAFVVCVFFGSFFDQNRDLAIILTIGLLVLTLLRGILLFSLRKPLPPEHQLSGVIIILSLLYSAQFGGVSLWPA